MRTLFTENCGLPIRTSESNRKIEPSNGLGMLKEIKINYVIEQGDIIRVWDPSFSNQYIKSQW